MLLALVLLLKLAHDDLRYRRLVNKWVISYALMFVPYAWGAGFSVEQLGLHGLTASVAFLVLLLSFVLGVMGGGDVKLGSAVLLWAGPTYALSVLVLIAWVGGVLAVLGWLVDRSFVIRFAGRWVGPVCRVLSARRGVPYGVALAGGGIWLVLQQF